MSGTRRKEETDWIGVFNAGVFIILVGATWAVNPNLGSEAISFFKDFQLVEVSSSIMLPAPVNNHPVLYRAVANLMLVYGLFQIVILGLRILFKDSFERKIGSASGIVFLVTLSLFLSMLADETISWLGFLGGLLICIGLSIVTSSGIRLLNPSHRVPAA
ncbi:MAG: hypothetical protein FGF50_01920 [Candidatus Brockarchaeota archaeon]|nr:hypothetical protein [Candidatus Brockarchaeota archaeon]